MNKLQKELRYRFKQEYLSLLKSQYNPKKDHKLKEGSIVLVGSDIHKKITWPLGRIIQVFTGKDGYIRVARVKTQDGVYLRPVQRLYPLEMVHAEDGTNVGFPSTIVPGNGGRNVGEMDKGEDK